MDNTEDQVPDMKCFFWSLPWNLYGLHPPCIACISWLAWPEIQQPCDQFAQNIGSTRGRRIGLLTAPPLAGTASSFVCDLISVSLLFPRMFSILNAGRCMSEHEHGWTSHAAVTLPRCRIRVCRAISLFTHSTQIQLRKAVVIGSLWRN